jgi:competence protein ComGC
MAIIGIIMAVLLPALSKVRAVGKRTSCLSNLRQVGAGMQLFKIDNNLSPVPFISILYPNYVSSNKIYQCPADLNKELNSSLIDNDDRWLERIDNKYSVLKPLKPWEPPAYDIPANVGLYGSRHNNAAGNISYFYEMSEMSCNFKFYAQPSDYNPPFIDNPMTDVQRAAAGLPISTDAITWAMWKEIQLNRGGDGHHALGTPYSVSAFPVVRCFWHIKDVKKFSESNPLVDANDPIINVTYAGNYVLSKLTWENGIWNP